MIIITRITWIYFENIFLFVFFRFAFAESFSAIISFKTVICFSCSKKKKEKEKLKPNNFCPKRYFNIYLTSITFNWRWTTLKQHLVTNSKIQTKVFLLKKINNKMLRFLCLVLFKSNDAAIQYFRPFVSTLSTIS